MAVLHRVMNAPDKSAVPLLDASIKADAVHLESLISGGANVNEQDDYGWTSLHLAAAYGHTNVVKALLRNGADPNLTNAQGRNALMYAAAFGYSEIVKGLVTAGTDVNATSKDPDDVHTGETALMLAAWSGYVGIINMKVTQKRYGLCWRRRQLISRKRTRREKLPKIKQLRFNGQTLLTC
jgi:hypothetical protein